MRKLEKNYIITAMIALIIDFGIIIYMYSIPYLNSTLVLWVPDTLLFTGIALFLYIVIFCVTYFIKIIVLSIMKKEKYSKKEITEDLKRTVGSLIGILVIFFMFSAQVKNEGNEMLDKPVIYLYPESQIGVQVKLNNIEKLAHTYPKYIDGWNVIANPSGNLVDIKTGRNLYCLYWEGKDDSKIDMTEGFIIPGKDTINFLEEKLEILGLNEREANEFIIYWLPKMENNEYNYIRFRTSDEINNYMQLDISPKPDSVIRVVMDFKSLHEYIVVKQQKLITPPRSGFVAVEWGARELQ